LPTADLLLGPSPLDASHAVDGFDCGVPPLNDYLTRQPRADQKAGKSRTYVATRGRRVVAFFSLAAAGVVPADASERAARGQGPQLIPAIFLARLAVDSREQGMGLGQALLLDALARCEQAADVVGVRVVLVHAKDEAARAFYARHDFEPSPTCPLHLMILMKDVRATLGHS
jgi:GNAT superfamily N-acetyltransferase